MSDVIHENNKIRKNNEKFVKENDRLNGQVMRLEKELSYTRLVVASYVRILEQYEAERGPLNDLVQCLRACDGLTKERDDLRSRLGDAEHFIEVLEERLAALEKSMG